MLITIGVIQLGGAMLPGVDFALVVKNTLQRSRKSGIYTAAGIAMGLTVHLSYGFLGVVTLLKHSPTAFHIFKLICAAYLAYLAIQLIRHPIKSGNFNEALEVQGNSTSKWQSFKEGFICNVFNPKAIVFFVSFFALILQGNPPLPLKFIYGLEIIIVTFFWFSSLAILITLPVFKKALDRAQTGIGYGLALMLLCLAASIFFL